MRGGYRGVPKPKLPSHLRVTFRLKRVHVNARIQKWMLDELKKQGEVGIVLEYILEKMQDLSINLKNNDFLPDYNGALPQAPGFSALRTQAWLIKRGAAHHTLPPCFSHQFRRSGCFPARALSSELVMG